MKMVFFIFAWYLTIFLKASAMYMPKNLGGKKTEQKLFNGIKIAFERQLKSQITQLQWIEPIYFNGTFRNWLSSRHTTNITLDLTGSDAILMHWPNKYQIKWSFYQVFQQTFLSEFFFLLEKRLQNGLHNNNPNKGLITKGMGTSMGNFFL